MSACETYIACITQVTLEVMNYILQSLQPYNLQAYFSNYVCTTAKINLLSKIILIIKYRIMIPVTYRGNQVSKTYISLTPPLFKLWRVQWNSDLLDRLCRPSLPFIYLFIYRIGILKTIIDSRQTNDKKQSHQNVFSTRYLQAIYSSQYVEIP